MDIADFFLGPPPIISQSLGSSTTVASPSGPISFRPPFRSVYSHNGGFFPEAPPANPIAPPPTPSVITLESQRSMKILPVAAIILILMIISRK
jgi:hypothetical protein